MLYCVIHDKYFQTLSEFETHVEEHQMKLKKSEVAESVDKPISESVIQQGE
jgi:hypothetical protein